VEEPLRFRHYCSETIEQQAVQTFESGNRQVAAPLWRSGVLCQAVLLNVQSLLRRDVLNAACVSIGKPRGRPKTLLVRCSFESFKRLKKCKY